MLKLKTKEKEITVPTSWDELTTAQFQKLSSLINLYRDEETEELNIDGELLFQKIAQSILNIPRQEVLDMDFRMIIAIKAAFGFLNTPMPKPKNVSYIKYKNHILKLKDFNELTFGEFADIQQSMVAEKKDELKLLSRVIDLYEPKNILKFRFKDRKINISNEDKIKIINEISCIDFNNLSFFLFKKMAKSLRASARSLNLMALETNAGTTLRMIGVIIRYSWLWLTGKHTKSKKPQTLM